MREELVFWVFRYKIVMLQKAENQRDRKYIAKKCLQEALWGWLKLMFYNFFLRKPPKSFPQSNIFRVWIFRPKMSKMSQLSSPKIGPKVGYTYLILYVFWASFYRVGGAVSGAKMEAFVSIKSRFYACLPYKIGRKKWPRRCFFEQINQYICRCNY